MQAAGLSALPTLSTADSPDLLTVPPPPQDCLANLALLPSEAALAVLLALWPLCRSRRDLQDYVVLALRKVREWWCSGGYGPGMQGHLLACSDVPDALCVPAGKLVPATGTWHLAPGIGMEVRVCWLVTEACVPCPAGHVCPGGWPPPAGGAWLPAHHRAADQGGARSSGPAADQLQPGQQQPGGPGLVPPGPPHAVAAACRLCTHASPHMRSSCPLRLAATRQPPM